MLLCKIALIEGKSCLVMVASDIEKAPLVLFLLFELAVVINLCNVILKRVSFFEMILVFISFLTITSS